MSQAAGNKEKMPVQARGRGTGHGVLSHLEVKVSHLWSCSADSALLTLYSPCLSERTSEAPAVCWEAREGLKKVLMEVFLALVRENAREGLVLNVGEGINCSDSVQEGAGKGEKAKSNRYHSQSILLSVRAAQSSSSKELLLWWDH